MAIAGCSSNDGEDESPGSGDDSGSTPESTPEPTETPEESGEEESSEDQESEESASAEFDAVDIGVVSEWNAMRTRLRDPVILGHAEKYSTGAEVVGDIFERFEMASGEHNAHEKLEETSTENYEGFEEALGQLRERLEAEDLEGAHEEMRLADRNLRQAQAALTNQETVRKLSVLVMGTHVEDASILLAADDFADAAHEFSHIGAKFQEKGLHEMVAEADTEAADQFVEATNRAAEAAEAENKEDAMTAAHEAFGAATQGVHALAEDDIAGSAHMAALQSRGWDGATVSRLGGPSQSFAHAATLNEYRVRARDAVWLFELGETGTAVQFVRRALERFETARAHDALESANAEAYETFEGGLESLASAIEAGNSDAVNEALGSIDEGLRAGISALVSDQHHALLEAGYTKSRIEDAVEQYRLGHPDRANTLVQNVLADFEADVGTFHETLEETDEGLYDAFEHDHLEGLIEAFGQGNDDAIATHRTGIRETLLEFETALASTAAVSAVESGYMSARISDAVALAALDEREQAGSVLTQAFGHFEAGAGGFHEALESADHGLYERFEGDLSALQDQVGSSATVAPTPFFESATEAIYAVVTNASGASADAAPILRDVFAHFEGAAVHEILEEADHETYEGFESALDASIAALESGESGAIQSYAQSTLAAQFAAAGAPDQAPVDTSSQGSEESEETSLEGGPNVVDGVPDDADHVVDMQAVAYAPEELTIQQGETVAWVHAGGEPHSVTAYEQNIPEDAAYWASGGFDSEEAARQGWEEGTGAIQEGQSYVRTFETPGEHEYVCIPHEAAGMVGTVIVEE
jgi:plastocyanin